ncbi:hypothetical protein DY052_05835 [Apilactobacillus timberlakei]|uniref:hypothetical protein n=1 Tax=Apilactobacillus timberlakei TaxID=2008380 RepID=UPI00112CB449|nr:hypothetical protein [Apilactobacillus timberlakei]TPR14943.1 hypothetical protein DY052_05835 [Apilactobacillus timberlakei]
MNNTTQTNTVAVSIETLMQDNKFSSWKDYFNHMLFNMKMDTKKVKQELTNKNKPLAYKRLHCPTLNSSFVKSCLLKVLQYGEMDQPIYDFVLTDEQNINAKTDDGISYNYNKLINVLTDEQLDELIFNVFCKDYDCFDYNYTIYHVSNKIIKDIEQTFHKLTNSKICFEDIFDGVVENTPKGKKYYIIPDQPFNETEMRDIKWEIYKRLLGGEKLRY